MQVFNQQSSSPGKTSSEYKNSSGREKKKKLGRSIELTFGKKMQYRIASSTNTKISKYILQNKCLIAVEIVDHVQRRI